MAAFGLNIYIIDENGQIVDKVDGKEELVISPPSCGLSVTLSNKHHRRYIMSECQLI